MREKDLPLDRSKHAIYTKNAKKCVQTLLRRYYDEPTAAQLWEKIQLQYCAFLEDEPPMAGVKMKISIYDPILIFAWYAVAPDKPPLEDIQQDVILLKLQHTASVISALHQRCIAQHDCLSTFCCAARKKEDLPGTISDAVSQRIPARGYDRFFSPQLINVCVRDQWDQLFRAHLSVQHDDLFSGKHSRKQRQDAFIASVCQNTQTGKGFFGIPVAACQDILIKQSVCNTLRTILQKCGPGSMMLSLSDQKVFKIPVSDCHIRFL